jgi:DNA-directed RNA polymerase specialized sigma24 family protein
MTAFFARRTYEPETAVDLVAETFASAFESRTVFEAAATMKPSRGSTGSRATS